MKRLFAALLLLAAGLARAASPLQSLDGARQWLNSAPLSAEQLRGKVVLVDFWTYSCINCLRTLPWLNAWAQKYGPQGLVVIGVHAPEFSFEKQQANVAKAVQRLKLSYPVAIDTDFTAWRAFGNSAWPTFHVVDAQGRVRHQQVGESGYEQTERVLQKLLMEAGATGLTGMTAAPTDGLGLAADHATLRSPETYLGYQHGTASGIAPDRLKRYTGGEPRLNDWALEGDWIARAEQAELAGSAGGIVLRFHARDLHLVMGPGADGRPLRFRITLDGKPPGADAGLDVDAEGRGEIGGERLYQLVRQRGPVRERRFEIRFDAVGARAYAFTFG
ncbi:MAG TPA: thioredoxin family protein [Roseateles sp.]